MNQLITMGNNRNYLEAIINNNGKIVPKDNGKDIPAKNLVPFGLSRSLSEVLGPYLTDSEEIKEQYTALIPILNNHAEIYAKTHNAPYYLIEDVVSSEDVVSKHPFKRGKSILTVNAKVQLFVENPV